jgi:glucosamine--fructose-6-phosphate aminotransferase (isomerizing)
MGIEIVSLDTGDKICREPKLIDWDLGDASKGLHEHHMLKEILEQPDCMKQALIQDHEKLMQIALEILRTRNVMFTACGTSRHAALIGRYIFSKIGGKFCEVVMASEFQYFSESIDRNTLVIAVSQSGETADVMEGVKKAKAHGAKILSIVNVADSSLARLADYVIYTNCGPEIGVAATKSFTNQLVIFYLLAFAMMNRLEEATEKMKEIADIVGEEIEKNHRHIKEIAEKTLDYKDFYYIGRGINFAVASEGALKIKEISYVHAEGMPAGELKHGTIALIENKTPVIAICPHDQSFHDTLSNAIETKSRGAYVIGVSDEENQVFDDLMRIPNVDEIFYPLVTIIPLQIFAYYSATLRGKNPDKPRNLAKSVTVK